MKTTQPKPKGLKVKLDKEHIRMNLTLPPEMDQYLGELGHQIREQGGYKLGKTIIIRALIRLLQETEIELGGIKSEEDFFKRLKAAVYQHSKK